LEYATGGGRAVPPDALIVECKPIDKNKFACGDY
jgi:hypothetical protein